jgi:pyridoxal phosphate enzyme (YggS family)
MTLISQEHIRVKDNYYRVLENIHKVAVDSGRKPGEVKLVVVTKGHSLDRAIQVVEAGARLLGENYVEEAIPKIEALSNHSELEWHMIGHVQSRKARSVVEHFHWVHSVDSIKLAMRLDRFAAEFNKVIPVLLECNVSGEETKFGWKAWKEGEWDELLTQLEPLLNLTHIEVRGLMTMAPFSANPEESRQYFQRLKRLRDYLARHFNDVNWSELSMGMSNDYEVAIQEGATFVRIGTAILGERKT